MKKRKSLSILRKLIHNKEDIRVHFQRFYEIKKKYDILEKDIYNINKTGFQIDVDRVYKVIIREKHVQLFFFINNLNNYESLTFIECIDINNFLFSSILTITF